MTISTVSIAVVILCGVALVACVVVSRTHRKRNCRCCRFYDGFPGRVSDTDADGYCRRLPPQIYDPGTDDHSPWAFWPLVYGYDGDWCGEFRRGINCDN